MKLVEGDSAAKGVPSGFERHLQTALLTLVCAGILGIVGTITKLQESYASLNATTGVHLAQIDERVAELMQRISETYRRDDAKRDVDSTTMQINDLKRRMDALEQAVGKQRR